MPISIDEFESDAPDDERTNAERVVGFLARNDDKAYKAAEIAAATGITENSIHPVLHRLERRELVRHRRPYWAIGDIEAVRDATLFHSSAEYLDDVLGAEDRSEWVQAAERGDEE